MSDSIFRLVSAAEWSRIGGIVRWKYCVVWHRSASL